MAAINYAKYENKTTRQLSVLLDNAEKRLHKEIELVEYLRSKILESVKPTKYNFVPYTQSEAYKIGLKREKNLKSDFVPIEKVRGEYESFKKTLSQEQIAEIRAIKTAQINAKYDDE